MIWPGSAVMLTPVTPGTDCAAARPLSPWKMPRRFDQDVSSLSLVERESVLWFFHAGRVILLASLTGAKFWTPAPYRGTGQALCPE